MAEWDPFKWRERRENIVAPTLPLYRSACSVALPLSAEPSHRNIPAVGNTGQFAWVQIIQAMDSSEV